jgi:hypothetical protein
LRRTDWDIETTKETGMSVKGWKDEDLLKACETAREVAWKSEESKWCALVSVLSPLFGVCGLSFPLVIFFERSSAWEIWAFVILTAAGGLGTFYAPAWERQRKWYKELLHEKFRRGI